MTDVRNFPHSLIKENRHRRTLKIKTFQFDPSLFLVDRRLIPAHLIAFITVYLLKTENYKSHNRILLPLFLRSKYSPQHNVPQYPPLSSLGLYKSYHYVRDSVALSNVFVYKIFITTTVITCQTALPFHCSRKMPRLGTYIFHD